MTSNYTCVSVETTKRLCEVENSRARLMVKLDISIFTRTFVWMKARLVTVTHSSSGIGLVMTSS